MSTSLVVYIEEEIKFMSTSLVVYIEEERKGLIELKAFPKAFAGFQKCLQF